MNVGAKIGHCVAGVRGRPGCRPALTRLLLLYASGSMPLFVGMHERRTPGAGGLVSGPELQMPATTDDSVTLPFVAESTW